MLGCIYSNKIYKFYVFLLFQLNIKDHQNVVTDWTRNFVQKSEVTCVTSIRYDNLLLVLYFKKIKLLNYNLMKESKTFLFGFLQPSLLVGSDY